jgi:hypothetical protein
VRKTRRDTKLIFWAEKLRRSGSKFQPNCDLYATQNSNPESSILELALLISDNVLVGIRLEFLFQRK